MTCGREGEMCMWMNKVEKNDDGFKQTNKQTDKKNMKIEKWYRRETESV